VEVARRAAADSGFALIGEANAGTVLDALGNIDRELAILLPSTLAAAIGAGLVHHLAADLADRAGAFDGEEPLRRAHLAVAVALPAGVGAGTRLGAGTVTGGAADQRRHVDFDRAAVETLFEGDLEIVA